MKIKINKKSLIRCIDMVSKAVPQRTVIPITHNFLFVIIDNTCRIYAYNGKLQVQGQITVECPEDVTMCVPANTLMNTVKLLDEDEIVFNYNSEKFVLNIVAGKKKYKLTGFNPKDFPIQSVNPEGAVELKMPSSHIIDHIKTLSSIVEWNDIRPMMSGITMFSNHGKLEITGVHGSSYFYRGITDVIHEDEFFIVLHKDISIALANSKGKGDAEMTIGKKQVSVRMDGFIFTSVLIDVNKPLVVEKYFDFDREKYIVIDKNDLLGSLRRLSNYSDEHASLVLNVSGDELKLSTENVNFNMDGEEILDIENKDSNDRIFGLNIRFLTTIVSNIKGDKVRIFEGTKGIPMACIQDYENSSDSEMWGIGQVVLAKHKAQ